MSESTADLLRIALVCDPQLGFTQRTELEAVKKNPPQGADIDRMYFQQVVERINQLDPPVEAVLVAGDMVDAADNKDQWAEYARITAALGVPVYEAMGNHDGFTRKGLNFYRNVLKKRDYYSFTMRDVFFLVLNSNYLKEPDAFVEEADAHRRFIEKEFEIHRYHSLKILLMHHPLYFEHPDEEEDYFSLPPGGRRWVLKLVEEYNVSAVLSGHYHRNHIGQYKQCSLITSGPTSMVLGIDNDGNQSDRGFRVLNLDLNSGGLSHKYIQLGRSGRCSDESPARNQF